MMYSSRPNAEIVKGFFFVVALSTILVWVSHSITFTHIGESIFNQYATMRGEPFIFDGRPLVIHPFYNRILFPAIFVVATSLLHGPTDIQTFIVLRFLSFALCLSAIYVAAYQRRGASHQSAMIVCAVTALGMIPAFNHGWVHTSDIFDLTICLFMFMFIAEDRFGAAFVIACLTAVNRETGAFGAIAYVCLVAGRERPGPLGLRAALIGLVPYLGAIAVRKIILGDQLPLLATGQWYIGLSYNFELFIDALRRPSPIGWLMLLIAMMVLPWLLLLEKPSPKAFKVRVAIAFAAIFGISMAVGISSEVRTFIPCLGLLTGCLLARDGEGKTPPSGGAGAESSLPPAANA